MSVTYAEDPETRTIELTVRGRVTESDWNAIKPRFEAFMETHRTIRLIEVIEALGGFDASLIWEGIRFDFKAIPHISHCAVVTDIGWMSPIVRAASAVMPTVLRTFPLSELEAARTWLRTAE